MSRAAAWAAANGGALSPLGLSANEFIPGSTVTINITGATAGSTLSAIGLPPGWTLNSAARTITGTVPVGLDMAFTLIETLTGKAGSPKRNTLTLRAIVAAPRYTRLSAGTSLSTAKSILFVVHGQSIRHGSARRLKSGADPLLAASYEPILTRSVANRQRDPISPAKVRSGSWWPRLIDKASAYGIDVDVVNAAIGGSSIRDWAGRFKSWTANTTYSIKRNPVNGDLGDKGDFIVAGGKIWQATAGGRQRFAFNNTNLSYITYTGNGLTGATAPNWASVTTVGGTLVDGGVTWTLVENGNANNYSTTTAVDPTNATYGDPLGLHARASAAVDAALAAKSYDEVWYSWGTGSAETPSPNGAIFYANDDLAFRDRLMAFTNWALAKGAAYVSLGLDPWFPDLAPNGGSALAVNRQLFDVLDRGLERAIVFYQGGVNDGKVGRGPNLYRLFGFNPPVYPEPGMTVGVHLTDIGNDLAGDEEFRLMLLKLNAQPGATGAARAPFIEADPINLSGPLTGKPVNAPFLHISNTPVLTALVGQTVSLFGGNWAGGVSTSAPNIWYRDGVPIAGQSGGTYTFTSADVGKTITASATRSNGGGTNTVMTSNGVTVS